MPTIPTGVAAIAMLLGSCSGTDRERREPVGLGRVEHVAGDDEDSVERGWWRGGGDPGDEGCTGGRVDRGEHQSQAGVECGGIHVGHERGAGGGDLVVGAQLPDAGHDGGLLVVDVGEVVGAEQCELAVQGETANAIGVGDDRVDPRRQLVEPAVERVMLGLGCFGGGGVVGVEDAQDVVVLVVAVVVEQGVHALPLVGKAVDVARVAPVGRSCRGDEVEQADSDGLVDVGEQVVAFHDGGSFRWGRWSPAGRCRRYESPAPAGIPDFRDVGSSDAVVVFRSMKQHVREVELRSRIERLAAGNADFSTVRAALDRELRAVVGYDVGALSTLDPATMCWTSCFVSGVGHDAGFERVVYDHEFRAHEPNSYADLARADRPVGRLSAVTDGHLQRVGRYADLLEPLDAVDEMRAVLRSHGACWGTLTLYRQRPGPAYTLGDEATLAAVAPSIADLFRLTMLRAATSATSAPLLGPGLLTVTTGGEICERTEQADAWLDQLDDRDRIPSVVTSLAIATARGEGLARASLPSRQGSWITLHASGLRAVTAGGEDRVAIIIEAARPIQLNDLVAEAYGLTPREREVTTLITTGLANKQIAHCLGVSRYTVEDHVKSVFAKTAVANRGSLVALLQNEHYQPRADTGSHPGPYGWYLDDSIRIA